MKKILIIITLAFSLFFSANVLQAKTFTRSTETVSFAGADYTLLKSPFAETTTINGYNQYLDIQSSYIDIGNLTPNNLTISTPINSVGQYRYGNLAYLFGGALINWYNNDIAWVNDYFLIHDLVTGAMDYHYHLTIDYTFSTPSDLIVNVDNAGWFQASTNISKVSLDLYVTRAVYPNYSVNFYLTYYDNNNAVIGSSGAFGGNDTWIGLAFHGISQVDYDNGYQAGTRTGESKGLIDGYDNGYKDGKKDYGYNDNGTVISGESAFNKGYERGSNDNMPNFFVLITDSVFSAVTRIGNVEILPNLKISYIAGIILALGLVKFITGRKGDE